MSADEADDLRGRSSLGTLSVADGRTIAFARYGSEQHTPVVFLYGTPGSRLLSPQSVAAAERSDVQLLVMDRPGYGRSTRQAGRRVVDVVDDLARVADHLGWDRWAVWGGSGGGPHALACAALLPDRVTRCASVVGAAPFDGEGLDWLAGMSAGNVEEFSRAMAGESVYRPLVEDLARRAVRAAESGDPQVPAEYRLPAGDVAALQARAREPGNLQRVRAAYADGIDGWIDDCLAFVAPWGVEVSRIRVPVSIWFGGDDVLSPRAHADWLLQHIPGAESRELPGGGHLLADHDLDAVYTWLKMVTKKEMS